MTHTPVWQHNVAKIHTTTDMGQMLLAMSSDDTPAVPAAGHYAPFHVDAKSCLRISMPATDDMLVAITYQAVSVKVIRNISKHATVITDVPTLLWGVSFCNLSGDGITFQIYRGTDQDDAVSYISMLKPGVAGGTERSYNP